MMSSMWESYLSYFSVVLIKYKDFERQLRASISEEFSHHRGADMAAGREGILAGTGYWSNHTVSILREQRVSRKWSQAMTICL